MLGALSNCPHSAIRPCIAWNLIPTACSQEKLRAGQETRVRKAEWLRCVGGDWQLFWDWHKACLTSWVLSFYIANILILWGRSSKCFCPQNSKELTTDCRLQIANHTACFSSLVLMWSQRIPSLGMGRNHSYTASKEAIYHLQQGR